MYDFCFITKFNLAPFPLPSFTVLNRAYPHPLGQRYRAQLTHLVQRTMLSVSALHTSSAHDALYLCSVWPPCLLHRPEPSLLTLVRTMLSGTAYPPRPKDDALGQHPTRIIHPRHPLSLSSVMCPFTLPHPSLS